jgi:Flp pilus assembly protein TadD
VGILLVTAACQAHLPLVPAANPSLSPDLVVRTAWPFSKKKSDWGVPMSNAPDLSKSGDQYHAEFSERSIVSPAHGLEAPKEPNMFQRMGQSMSNSGFVRGIKSAFKGSNKAAKPAKPSSSSSAAAEEKDPDANLHVQLAHMQERSGNHTTAEAMFRKAVAVEPKNTLAHLELARYLDRQQRHEEAEQSYAKVLKLNANDASAWNDLGLCQLQQRKSAEAVQSLQHAIEIEPKRKLYRNNLARVLVEVGRADEALAQLQEVHSPAVAHYNLGYLLNERGQKQRAAAEFREALSHDPTLSAASDWLTAIEGGGQRTPGGRDDRTVVNRSSSDEEDERPDRVASMPEREEVESVAPRSTRLPVDRVDVEMNQDEEGLALPPLPELLDEPAKATKSSKPRMAERPGAPASR